MISGVSVEVVPVDCSGGEVNVAIMLVLVANDDVFGRMAEFRTSTAGI